MSQNCRAARGWGGPHAGFVVVPAVLLLIGSCAVPAPLAPAPAWEASVTHGTILAMRPVDRGSGGAEASVLASLAGASAAAGSAQSGPATDFVVREAGGATISVVQTNDLHFRVGEPVAIIHGERTRLSRPGA